MKINISIIDKENKVRSYQNSYEDFERTFERSSEGETYLAAQNFEYQDGDKIIITTEHPNTYLKVQLDEALAPTIIYLKGNKWEYTVPIDESLRNAYSDIVFKGKHHFLRVKEATKDEITTYRNIALNPHDQKNDTNAYPHAHANVETRNDSTFFARNAIDGIIANESHGNYPYQSWGINRQADAALTIDFGRTVKIDKIGIVLRGDYPHDSWWTKASLEFSDGTVEVISPKKLMEVQYFEIPTKETTFIIFKDLIKAEDNSPFPALTELEVYGVDLDL